MPAKIKRERSRTPPSFLKATVGKDLTNHVERVRTLSFLIVDDFIPILRKMILTYLEKAKGSRKDAVKFALKEWKKIKEKERMKAQ